MTDTQSLDFSLTDDELHLYSRQVLLADWDIEAQEKLKLSNILIVGCGGLGCSSAEYLARAGVGKITLLDADVIEVSNLQRQIAFGPQHVGFYKAEVLAERLRQINPHIEIQCHTVKLQEENIEHFFAGQDLILDGCDNFSTRYLVNQHCVAQGIALISASAIALQGQMFMVMPDSACYQCLFPKQQLSDEGLRCADSGVLATTPAVMASLQAHHALLYLGLGLTPLKQKLLLWDGRTLQQRILDFQADPDCPVCQQSL
ncbi:HesA/MoeB/ThiF family protein [Acinetobacter larvae]|uniref:Molybdopterin biosynthesis protein n=1 Tax=Acinetobacter larvae TaxID=1789224 RepID=A0A1B2M469_9GAMM|nr:HesA/MoeB/ThiF family protein [Acinetobacter larvae]AOA59952.1 molybdopterin biosynthesis protein [Acinetobacter larvae]